MNKVVATAAEAVADIPDGASIAVGGFGLVGVPIALIRALKDRSVGGLEIISNNCGVDDWGLGELLQRGQIRRMVASYVGENKEFARQYLAGDIELEFCPQGTLAERMRCGGAGVPAFYTPTGVGTMIEEGGLPWRYGADGDVLVASAPKETRVFAQRGRDRTFVLEHAIEPDFALVRAAKGDSFGNLVYERSGRAFNPVIATCGQVTIAEVEELVAPGEIDPDEVDTPGIYVHRVVVQTPETARDLPIEKRTVRAAPGGSHRGEGAR